MIRDPFVAAAIRAAEDDGLALHRRPKKAAPAAV
jgi:hypothetical protein